MYLKIILQYQRKHSCKLNWSKANPWQQHENVCGLENALEFIDQEWAEYEQPAVAQE